MFVFVFEFNNIFVHFTPLFRLNSDHNDLLTALHRL